MSTTKNTTTGSRSAAGLPQWKKEYMARQAGGSASAAKVTAEASRKLPREPEVRYCRFEDHRYNNETHTWIKSNEQLRMCPNSDCKYRHRVTRPEVCPGNKNCADYNCKLLHSLDRPKPCRFGAGCLVETCKFAHPADRRPPCPFGANCYNYASDNGNCDLNHPRRMNRICRHDKTCRTYNCQFIHHADAPQDCPDGLSCQYQPGDCVKRDEICGHKHPRHEREFIDSRGQRHFL